MSGPNQLSGDFSLPGLTARQTSKSRQFRHVAGGEIVSPGIVIESATVDAGGTPTTELRPGLVLVRIETGGDKGKYCQFGHASSPANNEIQHAVILNHYVEMRGADGVVADKQAQGLIGGVVNEAEIIFGTADATAKAGIKDALHLVRFVPAVA